MHFEVEHLTRYDYSGKVYLEPHTFRMRPRSDSFQRLLRYELTINPKPAVLTEALDAEGNPVALAWFSEITEALEIRTSFEAETLRPNAFDYLLQDHAAEPLPLQYRPELALLLAPSLNLASVASPGPSLSSSRAHSAASATGAAPVAAPPRSIDTEDPPADSQGAVSTGMLQGGSVTSTGAHKQPSNPGGSAAQERPVTGPPPSFEAAIPAAGTPSSPGSGSTGPGSTGPGSTGTPVTAPARSIDGSQSAASPGPVDKGGTLAGSSGIAEPVVAFARSVAAGVNGQILPFLSELSRHIHQQIEVPIRETGQPMPAEQTLRQRNGACRDVAVLFMDCCRSQGIAARFVSGYQQGDNEAERSYMHAWAEVYIPGGGWRGYDPTHGLAISDRHIAVAASARPELASPTRGTFRGTGATARMQTKLSIHTK